MNREIKFRGYMFKSWEYGSYIKIIENNKRFDIIFHEDDSYTYVYSESIGQFTGLYDKNGKEIYEGDIVIHFNHNEIIREVIFMKGSFGYWTGEEFISYASNYHFEWNDFYKSEKIEIIGNIYENPELLKSEGEK